MQSLNLSEIIADLPPICFDPIMDGIEDELASYPFTPNKELEHLLKLNDNE